MGVKSTVSKYREEMTRSRLISALTHYIYIVTGFHNGPYILICSMLMMACIAAG
jgi:hypothetical protein